MTITPSMRSVIAHFAEVGPRWGVRGETSAAHVLLYLTGRPMTRAELAAALGWTRRRPRLRSAISSAGAWRGARARPCRRRAASHGTCCSRRSRSAAATRSSPPLRYWRGRADGRAGRHAAQRGGPHPRPARPGARSFAASRNASGNSPRHVDAPRRHRRPPVPDHRLSFVTAGACQGAAHEHRDASLRPVQDQRSGIRRRMRPFRRSRRAGTRRARSGTAACCSRALVLGPIYFTWSALPVFLALCFVTLCFGHSVGFHRRLIHRSFKCPKWLERILIYLGTVVGMGGPLWTIRTHDMRDWAQRSPTAIRSSRTGAGSGRTASGTCTAGSCSTGRRASIPVREFRDARFYRFLDGTAMLQQLPIALVLFALGGMPWLVWGVCVRVAACTTMHWYISRLAHTRGPQRLDGRRRRHHGP